MAIVMLVRNTTDLQNLEWKPDNDAQAEKKAKETQIWAFSVTTFDYNRA